MPWAYVGGIGVEPAVECLRVALDAEPERTELLDDVDPGITVWTWRRVDGEFRVQSFFGSENDWFEVESEDSSSNLDLGIWLVEHCEGAYAIVDDPRYCSTGGSDFVRVTAQRIELIRLVDDESGGAERIDESLTTLITSR